MSACWGACGRAWSRCGSQLRKRHLFLASLLAGNQVYLLEFLQPAEMHGSHCLQQILGCSQAGFLCTLWGLQQDMRTGITLCCTRLVDWRPRLPAARPEAAAWPCAFHDGHMRRASAWKDNPQQGTSCASCIKTRFVCAAGLAPGNPSLPAVQ